MKSVLVTESQGKLVVDLSKHLLTNHLAKTLILFMIWSIGLAAFFLNCQAASTDGLVRKQPLIFIFLLSILILFVGLVRQAFVLLTGKRFVFDRNSNYLCCNSKRLTTLSSIKHVEISSPGILKLGKKIIQLRSSPQSNSLASWPSVWIILTNHRRIQILDTMPLRPLLVNMTNAADTNGQIIMKEAENLAFQIAQYTGVVLHKNAELNPTNKP